MTATQTASLPRWARLPLALVCGLAMGLAAAPWNLWYLGFAGLVGAFWLAGVAPKGVRSAGTGWMVGLGYFGFSMGWIVEPFMVDPAETGWMAPFGLLGLGGGLALFWALAFWAAGHLRRWHMPALVIAWTAAELARGYVLTGLPWGLIGYLWLPVPPIQWVSLVGPYGLTFLTLAAAGLLAEALPRPGAFRQAPRPWPARMGFAPGIVLGLALLAALFGGGRALVPPVQDLDGRPVVRLVQPNAPQHLKWRRDMVPVYYQRQMDYTGAPAEEGREPALIVWPETALPMLLHDASDALSQISLLAGKAQVVVGLQREEDGAWYNMLALMGPNGTLRQVYDKYHLVPFGEYMPAAALFAKFNILGLASRAEGGYTPGSGPMLLGLGGTLGTALPLICYEAVFPQDVHAAPARPDMLLQITNDAWFGSFSGPYQHLAQARIRAIEQGLPMVRAANTGVSAVIDGAGRVLAEIPLNREGYLDTPLPPPMRLTVYSKSGDLPVLLMLFVLAGLLWRPARREAERETD
ncbi:apolipoprotein N-acyltransferase [Sagittula salina]|uniref:Apolipoprotein N-acyltransferase n=1 Tax=Sagittula salina TaxID=2820268 RepID=A0A940MPT0_9RHOB|nr:apolipoprotein N-acyltransferase [Sagittula salina]MBP0483613.1 apolipoprotein N-acyltransferase [Sagittula salina]